MTKIVFVNASTVLKDAEIAAVVPAIQKWDDGIVRPAWGFDPCIYRFMTWAEHQAAPPPIDEWPIYINRHSTDPGALGWHDQTPRDRPFGRVFVGDCLLYGISWTTDATHEAGEMRGNPNLNNTWTMPNGTIALKELCDPVEDDSQAIDVDGVKCSNIVLPAYFSTGPGPWDYRGFLRGPCPTVTTGGYQSLDEGGQWTQVTAMIAGGPPSYRSVRWHHGHRVPAALQ